MVVFLTAGRHIPGGEVGLVSLFRRVTPCGWPLSEGTDLQIHFRGVVNDFPKNTLKNNFLDFPSKKSPSAWGVRIKNGMSHCKWRNG